MFANDPDIFNRSLYLYSAGKMFNTEDWVIGWTIGSKALIHYLPLYAQWIRFNPNTPSMVAYRKFFERSKSEDIHNLIKSQKPKFSHLYDQYLKEIKNIDPNLEIVNTDICYYPLINVESILKKLPKVEIENSTSLKGQENLLEAAVEYLNGLVGEPRFQAISNSTTGDYLVVYKAFS